MAKYKMSMLGSGNIVAKRADHFFVSKNFNYK